MQSFVAMDKETTEETPPPPKDDDTDDDEVEEVSLKQVLDNMAKDLSQVKKQLKRIDECNETLHDDRVTVHKRIGHLKEWVGLLDRNLAPCAESLGVKPISHFTKPATYEPRLPEENPDQQQFHGRTSNPNLPKCSHSGKKKPRSLPGSKAAAAAESRAKKARVSGDNGAVNKQDDNK